MITPEQKQNYIDSPTHCPVCGKGDIAEKETVGREQKQFVIMRCNVCSSLWMDTYTLTDVLFLQ